MAFRQIINVAGGLKKNLVDIKYNILLFYDEMGVRLVYGMGRTHKFHTFKTII